MEQLLKILEDNARMSVEDIAAMLNKSPAEVAAMIDLARAQGIIKGYKTLVDWEKAGVNRVEAVIELNVSPKKSRGQRVGLVGGVVAEVVLQHAECAWAGSSP